MSESIKVVYNHLFTIYYHLFIIFLNSASDDLEQFESRKLILKEFLIVTYYLVIQIKMTILIISKTLTIYIAPQYVNCKI